MGEPDLPGRTAPVAPPAVAVVGPGRMGVGIATAVLGAGRGHRVTVVDCKPREPGGAERALRTARTEIAANLATLEALGFLSAPREELLGGLDTAARLEEALPGRALVFEALPEIVAVKEAFYRAAAPLLDPQAVIASATSTFHPDSFGAGCGRPEDLLCAHWLNPAFLIPLVEVAGGEKTRPEALERVLGFLSSIGKIPVAMKASPGFIVPRIQAAAMNEAVRILAEGVAPPEAIDTAVKAGFGFRLAVMGLVEFIDLGGVEILYHAGRYLHAKLGGPHFAPPPLLAAKIERGEVGPRAGRGFYDYGGVDVRRIFDDRYRGFVELLRAFTRSEALRFAGGIQPADRPRTPGLTEEDRKEGR